LVHQIDTGGHQFSSVLSQPTVPHIESVQRTLIAAVGAVPGPRERFQQRCPLPQHLLVVGAHRGDRRPAHNREIIQIAAPVGRVSANQRQILRGEQHRPQHPNDLARAAHR
jgi:hypothetical protein